MNGIVSSNIDRAQDKPNYRPGHAVVLGCTLVFLLGDSIATHFLLVTENNKLAGNRDYLVEGNTEQELEMLGVKRPDFMYTV